MNPVTVVCATRLDQAEFRAKSPLGRSFAETYAGYPVKVMVFEKNDAGLSTCYNRAIETTTDPDEILVFVHDDVLIVDFWWLEKLVFGLEEFQVVGVAGNRRRAPRQPAWCFPDTTFTLDDQINLSGIVGTGPEFPCHLNVFGPAMQECRLLDGVFLATRKRFLDTAGIRFDPRFEFHFYDLDFCRQAEQAKLRMAAMPIGLIHQSGGAFNSPAWRSAYESYLRKWSE